ncbi:hypothetical protein BCR42DRAFT_401968 [Absidia repens]|uniref:Uncharacterized protein n=1 Tax=Absidia repens TaxID=90262 RepID=A0A1X2IXC4_9FUNG|nr:hypothetical protein BCR42DRAFT_401968 [Absidia repens]
MNTVNKRKVDLWEDEWEKQADIGSSQRDPPNKAATYTAILEQQHEDLSQTCANLESTLALLTTKLNGLQSTLSEEQAKSEVRRQQHQQKLAKSIERAMTNYMQKQSGCLGTLHENQLDLDRLLYQHQILSTTLNKLEAHYEASLPSLNPIQSKELPENGLSDNKKRLQDVLRVAKLVAVHNRLEERYMKAKADTKAYQAGSQVLEKEIKKINGLPQIVPILKSTTESHLKEISNHQQCQANLPLADMIRRLGDLRIRTPLTASIQTKQNQHLHQTATRLKKIYRGLLRQRSNQQMLTYSYEVEMKHLLSYKHALLAYQLDLSKDQENGAFSHGEDSDERGEQQAVDTMGRIKELLVTYQYKQRKSNHHHQAPLDPQIDITQMTDDQVVKAIEKLVAYETQWNKQWSEDVNDNLDAIHLLDKSKQDLARTLFGDSATRQTLNIKPKAYDDMQWMLETMVNDLRNQADQLENESKVDDQLFRERRSFVSLFFTDPFTFESKMDEHLDSLAPRDSIFDSLY